MKIFGKTFFETASKVETVSTDQKMSFSTPFLKIGKGDLTKPYISTAYTVSGIVQFGSDNLYPQILDQMYYTSPMHSGCIDFIANAAVGGGYEYKNKPLTGKEKVDMYTFEKINKFKKLVRNTATDYLMHKRVCILIKKDSEGKFKSMQRLHPATIRNNQEIDKFVYCKDWSRRTGLIEYNKYSFNSKDIESVYVYQEESVGQDVYPLPSYVSVLNDVFLDGEIAFLQKSNIQNSIWPSLAIRIPKMLESAEEREAFKDGLASNSGAPGAGKVIVLQGSGFDNCPEVVSIPTNQNDKLFDTTIVSIMNKICYAHGVSPSIMGISIPGVQGNNQQNEMMYSIFEKNIVMPLRSELTEIYDDLLDIAGVKNSIIINDFQIIEKTIVDGQTKLSKEEEEKKLSEPIATNDALKNMTGKQQQHLVRIIRQYSKGTITKEVATIQLRNGFGLSEEDILLMLIETE